LSKSGLIERPSGGAAGVWQITAAGRSLIDEAVSEITPSLLLARYTGYREFRGIGSVGASAPPVPLQPDDSTPEDLIQRGYLEMRASVAQELVARIRAEEPYVLERLVVQLLTRLGYGGTHGEGIVLGKSGDEGVDGVIRGDKFGLDEVYVQAKRWGGSVGRPEVQQFTGACMARRPRRGS